MSENILLVGSGAREHSIAKAINRSTNLNHIFCLASNMNPGIASLCKEFIVDDFNDPAAVDDYNLN